MTHSPKIVNFIRFNISDNCNKVGGITEITIVKEKLYTSLVTVTVDVINTTSIEGGTTTDDAMDLLKMM